MILFEYYIIGNSIESKSVNLRISMHSPQLRAQLSSIQFFDNSHSFFDCQNEQCGWLSKQSPNTGGSGTPGGDGSVGGSGQVPQLFGQASNMKPGFASHSPMSAQ